jgi:hypothetical protein
MKMSDEMHEILFRVMTSQYTDSQTLLGNLVWCKHCKEVFDGKGVFTEKDLQCPRGCQKV